MEVEILPEPRNSTHLSHHSIYLPDVVAYQAII